MIVLNLILFLYLPVFLSRIPDLRYYMSAANRCRITRRPIFLDLRSQGVAESRVGYEGKLTRSLAMIPSAAYVPVSVSDPGWIRIQ
jgi:hypothetical protein